MKTPLPEALRRDVISVFRDRVRENPAAIALHAERPMSYAELDARAAAIAAALQARGIGRGAIVGLCVQRSADAIAALLGVLRCGAAYLPFDVGYPPALLQRIHADARPALMLVDAASERLAFWTGEPLRLASIDAPAAAPADVAIGVDDPAYVMYTSGSTGTPKGVVVPHRGIVRLVRETDYADFSRDQVFLQWSPLAFDASTFEIWGALLNGASLAIADPAAASLDELAMTILHHRVSTLWLTAGVFHLMVEHHPHALRPLRQLLAGGDVLSPAHVRRALDAAPACTLINGYGPTENTTFTCCYRVPRDFADGPLPIGRPIAQTTVHVLDEDGRPVPPGEPGELYAGGAGVALGYLNRADLNAERFIANPFGPGTLYRSGDRVRLREDGVYEFLGRADRQVKINGKRVELDDIEAALRRTGLVSDAAVVARELGPAQKRLEAYVSGGAAEPQALRAALRAQLPDYMQPALLTRLDALPLTPTGKIDRRALLALAPPTPAPAAAARPGDEVEAALLGLWRRVLQRPQLGLDDNFFDLGGSSLQLLELHAALRAGLKPDAALVDLFRHTRIRQQAQWIRGGTTAAGHADPALRERQRRAALAAAKTRARGPAAR
ncbi:non-ribosomal peptide synthetase [Solimonas flava]|uniref:non-ribosomal peptide synthetase n=1 Tax=Solimonas flava TaxID=415849 RepID=UPI0003FD0697|nr:non-ribosomal peptide synthetase [Solimonas flava]